LEEGTGFNAEDTEFTEFAKKSRIPILRRGKKITRRC
jgi:hypothetical protein